MRLRLACKSVPVAMFIQYEVDKYKDLRLACLFKYKRMVRSGQIRTHSRPSLIRWVLSSCDGVSSCFLCAVDGFWMVPRWIPSQSRAGDDVSRM